jgi:hypothetical protein
MKLLHLGDDSDFDEYYTEFVIPETHTISDSVNDGDEQRTVTHEQGTEMGGMSMKFVWQDISTLSAAWKIFCGTHAQFNIPTMDKADISGNISDTVLMLLVVNETNRYKQHDNSKVSAPFTFCCRIRKREYVTVDKT